MRCWINGSKNTLPKHSLNFHGRQFCRIEVLPAIEPDSFADSSAEQLSHSVYELIANRVDEHADDQALPEFQPANR